MAFGPEIHTVSTDGRPEITLAPIEPKDLKDLPVVGPDSPTVTYLPPVTEQHMRALATEGAEAEYYARMRDTPNRICWGIYLAGENRRQRLVGITGVMSLREVGGERMADGFTYLLDPDSMRKRINTQAQPARSWWLTKGDPQPQIAATMARVVPDNIASVKALVGVGYHLLDPKPDTTAVSHHEFVQLAPRNLGETAIRLVRERAEELGRAEPNPKAVLAAQKRVEEALRPYASHEPPAPLADHPYEFSVIET